MPSVLRENRQIRQAELRDTRSGAIGVFRQHGWMVKTASPTGEKRRRGRPTVHEPKWPKPALRELSKANQITQENLAEVLGYHPSTIRRWESGTHRIPDPVIKRLLTILNCTHCQLFPEYQVSSLTLRDQARIDAIHQLSASERQMIDRALRLPDDPNG